MQYNVDNYGGYPIGINDAVPGGDAAALRATNSAAIKLAIDIARSKGGGEIVLNPGVYHTDGPVGLDVNEDSNVSIVLRGKNAFPTIIWSHDETRPCFQLHTSVGNIRSFLMEDVVLRGGKQNLSLHKAAYNRFNNVWFWGLSEWGVQSYQGQQNQFNNCNFAEIGTSNTDAALFLSCHHATLNNCNFGENGGGVVCKSGMLTVNGGTGYGAWYHGNQGHRWDLEQVDDLGLVGLPESLFSVNGGNLSVNGGTFDLGHSLITSRSAEVLTMHNVTTRSGWSPSTPPGPDFHGFINFSANPGGKTAMNVANNVFQLRSLGGVGDSGHIINTAPGGDFKGCIVANNQILVGADSTLIPLSVSAPSLFVPANGNIVENIIKTPSGATIE